MKILLSNILVLNFALCKNVDLDPDPDPGSGSGFTKFAGSGSGFDVSGSTTLFKIILTRILKTSPNMNWTIQALIIQVNQPIIFFRLAMRSKRTRSPPRRRPSSRNLSAKPRRGKSAKMLEGHVKPVKIYDLLWLWKRPSLIKMLQGHEVIWNQWKLFIYTVLLWKRPL